MLRKAKTVVKILSLAACLSLIACESAFFSYANSENIAAEHNDESAFTANEVGSNYFDYFNNHQDIIRPELMISVPAIDYKAGDAKVQTIEGKQSLVFDEMNSWAEWEVTIQESGLYSLFLTYYQLPALSKDILISVIVDDKMPFSEASDMSIPRLWKDKSEGNIDAIEQDMYGNDLRPQQVEAPQWNIIGLRDAIGLYEKPYLFELTEGTHRIRISLKREAFALSEITLGNQKEAPDYQQYISRYNESDYAKHTETVRLEAEKASLKNSSILAPSYDLSDAATLPIDASKIRINTIGGGNWNVPGSSISWTVKVPESGLYQLAFRAKQNFSEGMKAYRRLYINGKVPFKEADTIEFDYKQNWYIKTLGDNKPLYVYFKDGDILTLECDSSKLSMPMREIQQSVLELNNIYRDIIVITGTTPDIYQDYMLEEQIPGLKERMHAVRGRLNKVLKEINDLLGSESPEGLTISKTIKVIDELAEDTYFIPERLGTFKGGIESLSSLLLTIGGQPLQLDCIYFIPKSVEIPKARASLFSNLSYGFKRFVSSFFNDYNSFGVLDGEKAIVVWANLGRDQVQLINRLKDEQFTEHTGIPVVLNMVSGDAVLLKAILAGKGPDVALNVAQTSPVNLAARKAIVDLKRFDLSKLQQEIYETAWEPFKYNGGIYAIPETMNFDVMFYRTDIFNVLGLKPPETWDDFYNVLEVLQSNRLQVGLQEVDPNNQGNSHAINTFNKFFFQNGGDYFNDKLSKTKFDTEIAYSSFEKVIDLYKKFGISRDINFFNRFRSGEAPLGIAGYGTYMQLQAAAPELRGLWSFTMIPGTRQKDGTINRLESSSVTGCVMISSNIKQDRVDQLFQFMEWWTGSETQIRYGSELEAINGLTFRIAPANHAVLENLGWSGDELAVIGEQMKQIKNPPQVLAGYTLSRSLTSAIRGAINNTNTPRRSLAIYNKDINYEIMRKRQEFGLDG